MRSSTLFLAFLALSGLAVAQPMPAFGPQTVELTAGENETVTESFVSEEGGARTLFVRNGDGEGSRVASLTVTLNDQTVVHSGELQLQAGLARPVELLAGANELVVELGGDPGSFVTLAIGRPDVVPLFVTGRLVLPWGRDDEQVALQLALKNGSPRFPRALRVVFFDPQGRVVGASERIHLAPRASFAAAVDQLIDAGSWQAGSLEVFYAGPGAGRLFGSSRQLDPASGRGDLEPLQQAGVHVFPEPPPHGPRPRPLR